MDPQTSISAPNSHLNLDMCSICTRKPRYHELEFESLHRPGWGVEDVIKFAGREGDFCLSDKKWSKTRPKKTVQHVTPIVNFVINRSIPSQSHPIMCGEWLSRTVPNTLAGGGKILTVNSIFRRDIFKSLHPRDIIWRKPAFL